MSISGARVITETSEARLVVDRLMEQARPLGVDMEGVASDKTGLVQISDTDRNISLFRSVVTSQCSRQIEALLRLLR